MKKALPKKCGTVSGKYTTTKIISDPAARSLAYRDMGLGNGSYFCAMTAYNQFGGETAATSEIFFAAGVGASIPGKFAIQ